MKKLLIRSSLITILLIITAPCFASEISLLIDNLANKKKAKEASYRLAEIGKPAVLALIKALEDGDKYQKRYAARAIREMGQDGFGAR